MIDDLIRRVGNQFAKIKDHRASNSSYYLSDSLKGALAMFSLKDRSLLLFRQRFDQRQENLKRIYGLEQIPGDNAMRESIDGVDPESLQEVFALPWREIRQEDFWRSRKVLGGYVAISVDGTQHYCSTKKSCPHCLIKRSRNGKEQYYHQLLAAVQVHPQHKEVFPVVGEAIVRQDGAVKNDCEQNAAKRLVPKVRQMLPTDPLLFVADALYASGPFVKLLQEQRASFLITIKEGYVLVQAQRLAQKKELHHHTWSDAKTRSEARWASQLVLNGQHQQIRGNYLEYEQMDIRSGAVTFKSSWITDLPIDRSNVKELVAVGRSRWKIENETFNTLKNQGYQLEHNYGHGRQFLATNFALLMLLTFLLDQIAQAKDQAFQLAWQACKTKKNLWEKIRQVFDLIPALSMNAIYRFVAKGRPIDFPLLE